VDELLDLVNERDEVIGEVWKSEANSNPKLIHREIAILIQDKKNRLLLQQRSKNKMIQPGYWAVSCAGHVGKGENPEAAAYRELREELGIETELKFKNKILDRPHNETKFYYCYNGEYNNENFILQKEEVEKAKFFSKKEYLELEKNEKVTEKSIEWIREYWGIK
jgi:isopentenyl-diphosphate delta-isomerase type 1